VVLTGGQGTGYRAGLSGAGHRDGRVRLCQVVDLALQLPDLVFQVALALLGGVEPVFEELGLSGCVPPGALLTVGARTLNCVLGVAAGDAVAGGAEFGFPGGDAVVTAAVDVAALLCVVGIATVGAVGSTRA